MERHPAVHMHLLGAGAVERDMEGNRAFLAAESQNVIRSTASSSELPDRWCWWLVRARQGSRNFFCHGTLGASSLDGATVENLKAEGCCISTWGKLWWWAKGAADGGLNSRHNLTALPALFFSSHLFYIVVTTTPKGFDEVLLVLYRYGGEIQPLSCLIYHQEISGNEGTNQMNSSRLHLSAWIGSGQPWIGEKTGMSLGGGQLPQQVPLGHLYRPWLSIPLQSSVELPPTGCFYLYDLLHQ